MSDDVLEFLRNLRADYEADCRDHGEAMLALAIERLSAPPAGSREGYYTFGQISYALNRSLYAKTGKVAIDGIIEDLYAALSNRGDHQMRDHSTKEEDRSIQHVDSLGDRCLCLECVEDREWVKSHSVPPIQKSDPFANAPLTGPGSRLEADLVKIRAAGEKADAPYVMKTHEEAVFEKIHKAHAIDPGRLADETPASHVHNFRPVAHGGIGDIRRCTCGAESENEQ